MILWETAFQAETFLAFLAVGLASALLCDLASPALRSPSLAAHVAADFLLCAATGILCFFALALTGRDSLRLYMALALFGGAALYRLGIRRLIAFLWKICAGKRKKPERGE